MLEPTNNGALRFLAPAVLVLISVLVGLLLIETAISLSHPITTAYRWDAVTGYRLRPGLDLTFATSEFSTRIQTNGEGLRDPAWDQAETRPVVLLVGDSFVFGHGVEQADSFAARLQKSLGQEVRVVNAGHPGWDTRNELAWLTAEGSHFRPRIVVLGVVLNDMLGNSGQFHFSPTARGWLRHLPFTAVGATLQYLLDDPLFVLFRLGFNVPYGAVDHVECLRQDRCVNGWQSTARLAAQFAQQARRMGAQPVLAHLPTRPEITTDPERPAYTPDLASRNLADIAAAAAMPFVSVSGLSPGHYFPRDGHWNAEGHRAAAQTLEPILRDLLRKTP